MKTEPETGVTCLQARVTEDGWQSLGANIGGKEGPSLVFRESMGPTNILTLNF